MDDEDNEPQETLDLIARDPNRVNDHIRVDFDDVIAEADGTHSINCVWSVSFMCYRQYWKKLQDHFFRDLCDTMADDDDDVPQDTLDLIARDPNKINDHIRVDFDDVLAEADGTHSINCVWKVSNKCYGCSKGFCYNMCTFIMGIFIAFFWGMQFAYVTFMHVWCCTPMMRMFVLQCNFMQKCCGTIVNCWLAPTAEACGLFFSNIVVHNS